MNKLDINSPEYWERILESEWLWDIDKKLWFSDTTNTIIKTKIDESKIKIKISENKFEIKYKWKLAWVVEFEEDERWIYISFLWTPNWTEKTLWWNRIFDNKYYEYFNEDNWNTEKIFWMWPYLLEKFLHFIYEKWVPLYWKPIEWSEKFYAWIFERLENAWFLRYNFDWEEYEITF